MVIFYDPPTPMTLIKLRKSVSFKRKTIVLNLIIEYIKIYVNINIKFISILSYDTLYINYTLNTHKY